YTLSALYLRFILGHDPGNPAREPLLPPDILVVTFTIAATKELSDRIRARLTAAAACFSGYAEPDPKDAVLNGLLEAYPAGPEREKYAAHLQAATDWMDEAAIYTIHGFCNRMLTQHAFNSGSPFDLTLSPDEAMIREEATADYWREHFYPLSESVLETVGASISGNPKSPRLSLDYFRRSLKELMKKGTALAPPPNEPPTNALVKQSGQWHEAIHAIRDALGHLDTFNSALEKAWEDGVLKKNSPNQKAWQSKGLPALKAWKAQPDVLLPQPDEIDLTKLTVDALKNGLRVNQTLPTSLSEHPLPAAVERFNEICQTIEASSSSLYAHALQWIEARIQQTKEQRGLIAYNDMLTRLLDALNKPVAGDALANTIREQFPIALIDEFQDTDAEQYGIFQAIYPQSEPSAHSLFLIGDPKQAIYGFRGADLDTYLEAASEVPTPRRYTLGRNYRSTAEMVSATNTLFDQSPSAPDQFLQPMIRFYPVDYADQKKQFLVNGEISPALTIWQHSSALGATDYQEIMAARCADQIDQLLKIGESGQTGFKSADTFKPLQAADIAILVRTGKEADVIRQALQRRGHRSVYLSDQDNVLQTQQAQDVLNWLYAMAEPESERRVRTAIGTASLNYSWGELHSMFTNDARWEMLLESFWNYARLWRQRGILPALRRLIYDHQLAPRLLPEIRGERQLSNILQISEILQEVSVTLDGPAALIRWLNEQMAQSDESTPADEQILRLESDANLIQVATIHKSKGLEYPLVFLPFICSHRKSTSEDEQAQQAEALRLFYVAATRAVHACWLGIAPLKSLQKTAIGHLIGCQSEPTPEDLKVLLDALAAKDPNIQLEAVSDTLQSSLINTPPSANTEIPGMAIARTFKANPPHAERWWIASYSALIADGPKAWTPGTAEEDRFVEETQNAAPNPTDALPREGVHALPSGPATGT
ncbi:MAG: UvrD-helicase domain-containing protein, partial [Gammaproteobacteria bacterium]|nr:UvrD-helicase domain-containing protein [Gammaproteobacteria bacterium]